LSNVTGCRKTQMSECTGSTVICLLFIIKINVMSAVSFISVGKIVEKTTDLLKVYRHTLSYYKMLYQVHLYHVQK
jgi:hypothetical protein